MNAKQPVASAADAPLGLSNLKERKKTTTQFPILLFTRAGAKISDRTSQTARKGSHSIGFYASPQLNNIKCISSSILLLYFTRLSDRLSQLSPSLTL